MIEKLYTPQFGEFDTKKAVVEAHQKINELVDEMNLTKKVVNDMLAKMAFMINDLYPLNQDSSSKDKTD